MRWRWKFRGMCPTRSWNSWLACKRVSVALHVRIRKVSEGGEGSMGTNLVYLGEANHLDVHLVWRTVLWDCLVAVVLCGSGLRSLDGRASLGDESDLAAALAALSASSLPVMPSCPAIHCIVILCWCALRER